MNFIQEMRKRNLLGLGSGNQTFANPSVITVPGKDIQPRINPLNLPDTSMGSNLSALRLRETPDIQAYKDYLKTEPNRDNYKTGKVGKILAALAGFSEGYKTGSPGAAYATTKGILDRPYEEDLARHDRKGGKLKNLAEMEYQSLTDNQKLQVQIAEQEIKVRDQLIKEIKTASDIELNDAQIKNVLSQAKNRGLTVQKSEIDGQMYVIDQNNKSITPLGKFAESVGEVDTRKRNMFSYEHGIQQKGRESLQSNAQAHDRSMLSQRFANDASLVRLKDSLDDKTHSPAEQTSAFNLAIDQVTQQRPELIGKIFKIGEDGKYQLNVDANGLPLNPDAYNMFTEAVKQTQGTILGEQNNPARLFPNYFGSQNNTPTMPQVSSPVAQPSNVMPNVNINNDQEAIQALAEIGITNPTPEQIAEAKRDLGIP